MKPMDATTYKTTFEVKIPSLEGDEIAETVPIEVEVWKDQETDEEILTPESLQLIDRTKARRMGLMSPEEIRSLRERLDLTQSEMSDLLQIGEKSYTRWENGKARPSRAMNVLLCGLRDGRLDVNYLRSLRNPGFDWSRVAYPGRDRVAMTSERRFLESEQRLFTYWNEIPVNISDGGELLLRSHGREGHRAPPKVIKAYAGEIRTARYVLSETQNPSNDDPNVLMEWNTSS